MKVTIREEADADLDNIFAWIAQESPRAATEMVRRIRNRVHRLATPGLASMGRVGLDPETRELVERPYIIVYEVHEDRQEIVVLAIFHGAQDR
jgi:toxin ParE1/3/4